MVKYSQITERNKRRYYLHRRLSPSVNRTVHRLKTIFAYADQLETLTKGQRRNIKELENKFGYRVQLEIAE
jgi:uncharacterized protein YciW